MKISHTIPVQA